MAFEKTSAPICVVNGFGRGETDEFTREEVFHDEVT
jgi:hypothetical protein